MCDCLDDSDPYERERKLKIWYKLFANAGVLPPILGPVMHAMDTFYRRQREVILYGCLQLSRTV